MEPITSRAKLIESLKNVLSVETLARDSYSKDVHIFKNKRLKVVIEKIKQNLFWAFGYNVIAIPLAVAGLLNPIVAELAMALSSISVVMNANLLRRARI